MVLRFKLINVLVELTNCMENLFMTLLFPNHEISGLKLMIYKYPSNNNSFCIVLCT